MYLIDTEMASLTKEGMDVELMTAAQFLGIDIHIYHK